MAGDGHGPTILSAADIAVLTLDEAVTGVPPTPINTATDPRTQLGSEGSIAGFGAGSQSLRFGLDGEDNGSLDVDLFVRKGTSVSPSNADCQANGSGNC